VVLTGLLLGITRTQSSTISTNDTAADFSLEELTNIKVTSVSKKETSLDDAPAAVFVITQEDIRRSGLTSIPELLRMVPGLDVAQIDANHWAVSSRGFNNQYANKLLVLIDGRTVYSPLYGGVDWNVREPPVELIDRIEVIRGPGATLWGANAVNGVINIITKSAKDTQGGMVTVIYGTEDQPYTMIRYGGQLATNLFYRAYLEYFDRNNFTTTTGQDAEDGWSAIRTGFRLDWDAYEVNQLTLQGDYYYSPAGETIDATSLTPPYTNPENLTDQNKGGNVLSRWTHSFSDTSQLTLQSYYDHTTEGNAGIVANDDTYDLDLQHHVALGSRQDIVWGAGYRYLAQTTSRSFFVSLTPADEHQQLYSVFLQDDLTLIERRLHLTVGSKLEHNDSTGFEVEPSVRLAWTPTEKQTVWAAVSRAVRTPSIFEQDIRNNRSVVQPPVGPPVVVSVLGNPNLVSEEMTAYELGYRIKPFERLSLDFATFYNVYDHLIYTVQGAPYFEANPAPAHVVVPLTYQNGQRADTYGGELMGEWRVTENWKLTASYSLLLTQFEPLVTGDDTSPENQFQIHSYLNLPYQVELNGALYYVDQITAVLGDSTASIPSYFRLDLGLTWRPTQSLELGIWGQNLLADQHVEFTSFVTTTVTENPRSIYGRITWHF
jgi:iron complex outermembrane receptor protein